MSGGGVFVQLAAGSAPYPFHNAVTRNEVRDVIPATPLRDTEKKICCSKCPEGIVTSCQVQCDKSCWSKQIGSVYTAGWATVTYSSKSFCQGGIVIAAISRSVTAAWTKGDFAVDDDATFICYSCSPLVRGGDISGGTAQGI